MNIELLTKMKIIILIRLCFGYQQINMHLWTNIVERHCWISIWNSFHQWRVHSIFSDTSRTLLLTARSSKNHENVLLAVNHERVHNGEKAQSLPMRRELSQHNISKKKKKKIRSHIDLSYAKCYAIKNENCTQFSLRLFRRPAVCLFWAQTDCKLIYSFASIDESSAENKKVALFLCSGWFDVANCCEFFFLINRTGFYL